MKIAIVTSGDLSDMKGVMNYVHEKAKHMQGVAGIECDVYLIRQMPSPLFQLLTQRTIPKVVKHYFTKREDKTEFDMVQYHNLWYHYGVNTNIITTKIRKIPLYEGDISRFSKRLSRYDILASHTLIGHYLAFRTKQKYGVPFVATWHGSDINVDPFKNKIASIYTPLILQNADCNLFVSKALLNVSNRISKNAVKDVVYTGPSDNFIRSSAIEIARYREHNGETEESLIIGFVGNLIPIKNVLIIPDILSKVIEKMGRSRSIVFWIAGNGSLQESLQKELFRNNIPYKFFGKLLPGEIPAFMSCLNVLILPSLNEGLPLVTLEAKSCGVHVVASDVGGIRECIGEKNCFELDDNFSSKVSNRIVEILQKGESVEPLDNSFSWNAAIQKEVKYYEQIRNK